MVILADDNKKIAVKEGTVCLGAVVLKSFFYVEELKSDLIFFGQMMDENCCVVQLADIFLVIQDRATRTVIGVGKREAGSFCFSGVEHAAAVSARDNESSILWHNRFGHASLKALSSLPAIGVSISRDFSVDSCETCM